MGREICKDFRNGDDRSLRRKEIVIFAGLLIVALFAWFFMNRERDTHDYGQIRITVGGKEFGTYSLGEDQKISINGTNTCRILNGEAKMIEATCPDHLCIHQLAIDERGGFIICLPNEVMIEGLPSEDAVNSGDIVDSIVQ